MKNVSFYNVAFGLLWLLIAFSGLVMAPSSLAATKLYYCWDNDDNVRECGDLVPAQYSQRGFWKCQSGKPCEYVKPAPTPEEIAELERLEEEKFKRQEQTNDDCQFLNTYSSVTDIELARATAMATIDAQKQPIEMLLEAHRGNFDDQQKNYDLSKKNPSVSESQLNAIAREIQEVKNNIAKQEAVLQEKLNEQAKTNQRYDDLVQRYKYLKSKNVVGCQQDDKGNFYFICKDKGRCEIELFEPLGKK